MLKNKIARLNADGTLDNSFDCAACDSDINSVIVQPDSKIVIGTTSGKISRLNSDGSIDSSFISPSDTAYDARVAAIQTDGKILISVLRGGSTGAGYYVLRRLNTNGTSDNSLTSIIISGTYSSYPVVTQVRAGGRKNFYQRVHFQFQSNGFPCPL